VELIWLVDPEKCEVDVYSSLPLKTLRQGDTLSDDKILPGFSLPLSVIFEPVL
jgi:Uma2 family endonuclease